MNINGESVASRLSGLMKTVVLCTTGLTSRERAETYHLGRSMGAIVDDELTQYTTHLVCASVKSAKYEAATQFPLSERIFIVNVAYVKHCHDAIQRLAEMDFRIPPLLGLRIALSGFDRGLRKDICVKIGHAGGSYSPTLHAEMTDILVAKYASGPKYTAAVSWSIPCVIKSWLDDSVSEGRKLEHADYRHNRHKMKHSESLSSVAEGDTFQIRAADTPESDIFDNTVAFITDRSELKLAKCKFAAVLSRGQGTLVPVWNTKASHLIVDPDDNRRSAVITGGVVMLSSASLATSMPGYRSTDATGVKSCPGQSQPCG